MSYRNAEIAVYGILVVGFLAITILGILGHVQITLVVLLITIHFNPHCLLQRPS